MSQFRCTTIGEFNRVSSSGPSKVIDAACGRQFIIYRISNNVFYSRGYNYNGQCAITDCNDEWIINSRKIDFFEESNINHIAKVCSGSNG
eukprot:148911_1